MDRSLGFLVLSFLLVPANYLGQGTVQRHSHPGTVIDAYRRNGILAEAYAYASQGSGSGTDCPTYGPELDAEKSVPPGGAFTFRIDSQTNSYLAVYCQQGYAPRTETINDNRIDNTRVRPDPITLYPKSLPGVSPRQIATMAIGTDLEALHKNFSYYSTSSEKGFAAAVQSQRFSDEDRSIILLLQNLQGPQTLEYRKPYTQQELGPYEKRPSHERMDDPKIAFVAVASDLNHVRSDFRYYASADEGGYKEAVSSFPPNISKAIEMIRTRKEPFGNPL
jgi:hypothetical protein